MAVKRKSTGNRRRARSKASRGIPAWFWLLGGILIGLGTAAFLMVRGYLPEIQQHLPTPDSKSAESGKSAVNEEEIAKPKKPRYDFFTVLPEMEVVVPEQELSRKADKTETVTDSSIAAAPDQYILQAGSFRNATDAEQMKARLAMMGSTATIQTVTVNGDTWHRVRIGPFKGARKADEMRRMLSDNQIDTMVVTGKP